MTRYKASLKDQKISLKDAVINPTPDYDGREGMGAIAVVGLICIGAIFGAGLLSMHSCAQQPMPVVIKSGIPAPYTTFARMTSHVPAKTVRAIVQHSKYPRTLTAIAAVETGKRGTVRTKGDSGKSRGVFQVQRQWWGPEGDTLEEQVKQADAVFDALVQQYGYRSAVKRWNGSGKAAEVYRRKVMAQLGQMQ